MKRCSHYELSPMIREVRLPLVFKLAKQDDHPFRNGCATVNMPRTGHISSGMAIICKM